ncbi:MAG: paraquat-inducible protein A [Bacteroidales bacterium]
MPGRPTIGSIARNVLSALLVLALVVGCIPWISGARQQQELKSDLARLNHIRYGLLNVDEWTEKISLILSVKIMEFQMNEQNRTLLQGQLENLLRTILDEMERLMEARTSGTFSGIKRWVAGFAVDMDQIRDSIPSYADRLLDQLHKPTTRMLLQQYLQEKLDEFTASTHATGQGEELASIRDKYGCTTTKDCAGRLRILVDDGQKTSSRLALGMLLLAVLVFLVNMPGKGDRGPAPVLWMIAASLVLLVAGISAPMIDLEARIDDLRFVLLGEDVHFSDNILYFQSKSITDMVAILLRERSFLMISVGILIFGFSIVFPSAKLLCSAVFAFRLPRMQDNRIIRFFVLRSGKWSMADVMVVAIFMSYVGLNGILGNQLESLEESARPAEILTTNGTRLLDAFYLFLSFVLSSLALSEYLQRRYVP